jgi:hypothetical protein
VAAQAYIYRVIAGTLLPGFFESSQGKNCRRCDLYTGGVVRDSSVCRYLSRVASGLARPRETCLVTHRSSSDVSDVSAVAAATAAAAAAALTQVLLPPKKATVLTFEKRLPGTSSTTSKHYVYVIHVVPTDGSAYRIYRRYSNFHSLYTSLGREFPATPLPILPPKHIFQRSQVLIFSLSFFSFPFTGSELTLLANCSCVWLPKSGCLHSTASCSNSWPRRVLTNPVLWCGFLFRRKTTRHLWNAACPPKLLLFLVVLEI